MQIQTIEQAEQHLQRYIPVVATYTGDDMSLVRMWPLLELFGNPQGALRAVHIAGTSGKTSTAYYIASCLSGSGQKTGLTVSPHVDSITERVQIDGAPISDAKFCSYLQEFLEKLTASNLEPSYFELLTAFTLWVFVQEKVSYAVVETGLGGLLDASNVLQRQDKVCVITDIGFDHTEVLGATMSEIAAQKAGIIHEGSTVFMHKQSDEVMSAIKDRAMQYAAVDAHIVPEPILSEDNELAMYQQRNWSLSEKVCMHIAQRDDWEYVAIDPLNVNIPGRMDIVVSQSGEKIIMDGAHNKQKMSAFVGSLQQKFPGKRATVLLGLKQGKEYRDVLQLLLPVTDRLIITTFTTSQDTPIRSIDPEVLYEAAVEAGFEATVVADHAKAYSALLQDDAELKVITGSFYLIGQVRTLL